VLESVAVFIYIQLPFTSSSAVMPRNFAMAISSWTSDIYVLERLAGTVGRKLWRFGYIRQQVRYVSISMCSSANGMVAIYPAFHQPQLVE
jgi:hypothetical protein